jgi:hypothetical protein
MKMYDLTLSTIKTLLPSKHLSRDRLEVRIRMLLCAEIVRNGVHATTTLSDMENETTKSHDMIDHIELMNQSLERIRENQNEIDDDDDDDDDITRLTPSELKRCSERMILFTFFGRARSGHVEPARLFEDLKRTLNSVPTTWYVLEHLAVSMCDVKYNHIRQYLLREAVKSLSDDDDIDNDDDDNDNDNDDNEQQQRRQHTMERLLVRLLDCSTSDSVLETYHEIARVMGFVQDVPFDSCRSSFTKFSLPFCHYIASEAFNDTIEPLSKRYRSADVQSIRECLLFFLHVCETLGDGVV